MTARPLVTIVTPTYQRSDTLLRAARSVVAQDYANVEHVVVGDRCPMLRGLEAELRAINPEIKLVHVPDWDSPARHYTAARIARVRNVGVLVASGDYVCQLDSDNTLDENHVSLLADVVTADSQLVGAGCYRKILWPDGTPYTEPLHPWCKDRATAQAVYAEYRTLGVYTPGSHIARERLSFGGQFFGLDANEIFLRREVHVRFLFPMTFDEEQIAGELGDDELLSLRLYASGLPFGYSGQATLNFYLGGAFTELIRSPDFGPSRAIPGRLESL